MTEVMSAETMSHDHAGEHLAKLAHMANQIGDFFKAYPEAEAVAAITDHINQFWSRRMREDFLGAFDAGSEAIHPLVRKAIEHIKQPRSRD